MANPYTSVSISNYNASPPVDDGSETTANQVAWDTIKTKLPDPIKTLAESINTNITSAFSTHITNTERNYINGLKCTNGTDTDHDIDVAAGECRDDTNADQMALSAITKRFDDNWAVGVRQWRA